MALENKNESLDLASLEQAALQNAPDKMKKSQEYLSGVGMSLSDFVKRAAFEPFQIAIDTSSAESFTRGVFQLQIKLGMPRTKRGCDGWLGKLTYGKFNQAGKRFLSHLKAKMPTDKIDHAAQKLSAVENLAAMMNPHAEPESLKGPEVKSERKVFNDAVTGYPITALVPEGADGSIHLLYTGQDQTVDQTIANMGLDDFLQSSWKKGERCTYVIVTGKDTGRSNDKYLNLKKKGALTSILNGVDSVVGKSGPKRDLTLSLWSRGGEGGNYTLNSKDPALSRLIKVNSFDSMYYGVDTLKSYAEQNPNCEMNVGYVDSSRNVRDMSVTQKAGLQLQNSGANIPNLHVNGYSKGKRSYLQAHKDIARDFTRRFAGLSENANGAV